MAAIQPEKSTFMKDLLLILYFAAFAVVFSLTWSQDDGLSGMAIVGFFLLLFGAPVIIVLLMDRLKAWWQRKNILRRMNKALAALSMSLEEVLEKAPYRYDHWQGEDGYRLMDVRVPDGFVGFAYSELEAKLWIVEHYLAEMIEDECSSGGNDDAFQEQG